MSRTQRITDNTLVQDVLHFLSDTRKESPWPTSITNILHGAGNWSTSMSGKPIVLNSGTIKGILMSTPSICKDTVEAYLVQKMHKQPSTAYLTQYTAAAHACSTLLQLNILCNEFLFSAYEEWREEEELKATQDGLPVPDYSWVPDHTKPSFYDSLGTESSIGESRETPFKGFEGHRGKVGSDGL